MLDSEREQQSKFMRHVYRYLYDLYDLLSQSFSNVTSYYQFIKMGFFLKKFFKKKIIKHHPIFN